MWVALKVIPLISLETRIDLKSTKHCLIEEILGYRALFFNIVNTVRCALSPLMNGSLHAMFQAPSLHLPLKARPVNSWSTLPPDLEV